MINVVIRTFNEGDALRKCLTCLEKQSIENRPIVIDSKSTDNTCDVMRDFNVETHQCIPFTYGKALNVGMFHATTELVAMLSCHCYVSSSDFLLTLSSHFVNENVAGVYARQKSSLNSNYVFSQKLLLSYKKSNDCLIDDVSFNNAASMIRRKRWTEIPFNEEIVVQEDIDWANKIRNNGYEIIYEPRACVEHEHIEKISDTLNGIEKEYAFFQKL